MTVKTHYSLNELNLLHCHNGTLQSSILVNCIIICCTREAWGDACMKRITIELVPMHVKGFGECTSPTAVHTTLSLAWRVATLHCQTLCGPSPIQYVCAITCMKYEPLQHHECLNWPVSSIACVRLYANPCCQVDKGPCLIAFCDFTLFCSIPS